MSLRSIKTHFGVIFSLVALLFSVQFGIFVNNLAKSYEKSIQNEYNIVLVSKKALSLEEVQDKVSDISQIIEIPADNITDRLKGKISDVAYEELSKNLPKFYSIKLENFPDSARLEDIESALKSMGSLSRVEIFKKTHDDIFKILLLIKSLVYGFALLIVVLGLMLIHRQMRIWVYEHKERIEIMELFGASFMIKSGRLYRMALADSVLATLIVVAFYLALPNWPIFMQTVSQITNLSETIVLPYEPLILFGIAVGLTFIAVTFVMLEVSGKKSQ
ncbi:MULTISPECIES: hypothetical protein [unclassified Campylobacter]|uniref:hypothetical protein n=1 Tax=unclassified Campylobacter TaxID=2593542 RepID=UPI0022E9A9FC|nr:MULTISPECIES: hypothetical protein [unclassified Campylobacter]MDA3061873.1 hypothetical protein [Campylobacter sp. JMF_14 EL1]MDA3073021.1 hypothetical protein [Campylobacter sp. JMF_10 EL2]